MTGLRPFRRDRRLVAGRDERGGASAIEAVLVVPLIVMFGAFIWAGARITIAQDAVAEVAGASARAASIADTPGQARSEANAVAASSLATKGLRCDPSHVSVDTDGFDVTVGKAASVTVTVTCRAPLGDLTLVPGLPGSKVLTGTSTSPLDRYRIR